MNIRKIKKECSVSEIHFGLYTYGDAFIGFSFQGSERLVKQIVRELLWGGVIAQGQYGDFTQVSPRTLQASVYIKNDSFADLVNMFRYRRYLLAELFPDHKTDKIIRKRPREKEPFFIFKDKYVKGTDITIAQTLEKATREARLRKHVPLIIHEEIKPDDVDLWTEEERLDPQAVIEFKNKTRLDKKYYSPEVKDCPEMDVHEVDDEGRTPLHLIFPELLKGITWLLDKGADVNATDFNSKTPLDIAHDEYKAVIEMLIAHGADKGIKAVAGPGNAFAFWRAIDKRAAQTQSVTLMEQRHKGSTPTRW